jgi:IMP dehydrogenase
MNEKMKSFFDNMEKQGLKLTFDDVRLTPQYSDVMPWQTNLRTRFSRRVWLNVPIVSAAMDTVTTADMAIAMAEAGGLGIIHGAMTVEELAKEVARVKKRMSPRIDGPFSFHEDVILAYVLNWRTEKRIPYHTFIVEDSAGKIVGMLSRGSFRLCTDVNKPLRDIMIPIKNLSVRDPNCSVDEAYSFMLQNQLQPALPLVNEQGICVGMYTPFDIGRTMSPIPSTYNLDANGHFVVGAAVKPSNALTYAEVLVKEGVDVIVVDSAHGDSKTVMNATKELVRNFPETDIVSGNVSTGEGAKRLADIGSHAVKIGQGPGSICTTRVQAGIGVPQVSAIAEAVRAVEDIDVPIIADGGINNPGDIVIAIATGASSVMLGRLLAGTEEAPGTTIIYNGVQYKDYRGMGSPSAMRDHAANRERYGETAFATQKSAPEGVEGLVPYRGLTKNVVEGYVGGVRAGMGYCGAATIPDLQRAADIFRMTAGGQRESHPHDIIPIQQTKLQGGVS